MVEGMDQLGRQRAAGCFVQCSRCPGADGGPRGGLRGRRLAVLSVGVFLVPLGLAIAAALAAGRSPVGELLAALAGLAGGLIAAAVLGRGLRRGGAAA